MALTQATKEGMWLRTFFSELGFPLTSLSISGDNQGAIALAKNPEFHTRTKHIRLQYHFIREAVEEGLVNISFIPTASMPADILTKGLPRIKHIQILPCLASVLSHGLERVGVLQ